MVIPGVVALVVEVAADPAVPGVAAPVALAPGAVVPVVVVGNSRQETVHKVLVVVVIPLLIHAQL